MNKELRNYNLNSFLKRFYIEKSAKYGIINYKNIKEIT